ncbi:Retrovirus-related Pol polyprotein from transposon TNT 1-94 [Linum perenne]
MKYALKYIFGSRRLGLIYSEHSSRDELFGYVDFHFASNKDNRKLTTSYYFTWAGNCISWKSQLRSIVALSSTEAKYIVVTEACKEATWVKDLLSELENKSYVNHSQIVLLIKLIVRVLCFFVRIQSIMSDPNT